MLRFLLWLTRVIFRKVAGKGTTMKARASPTLPCTGTGGGGGQTSKVKDSSAIRRARLGSRATLCFLFSHILLFYFEF